MATAESSVTATEAPEKLVTLIGVLTVEGVGVRDYDGDAMVYVNDEALVREDDENDRLKLDTGASDTGSRSSEDDGRRYLSYDFDQTGGRAVFQVRSGDEVEFATKNININPINCEVTNEHGVTLATGNAREMEHEDDKYDVDEAVCALTAP